MTTDSAHAPVLPGDLGDLDIFQRGEAWPVFDELRREDPLHWTPEPAAAGPASGR